MSSPGRFADSQSQQRQTVRNREEMLAELPKQRLGGEKPNRETL